MGQPPAGSPQAGRDGVSRVLVVGGSAGALGPLKKLLEELRPGMGLAVLVVLHRGAASTSVLTNIFSRHSVLTAAEPRDGDPLHADTIYVAPGGRHLELYDGRLKVNRGPNVNGHRPAIDVLFESAARWFGPAVVAVVLSGTLDDGSHGLRRVLSAGGIGLVQDPSDADFGDMPRAAIARAPGVDVRGTDELPGAVVEALGRGVPSSEELRTVGSEERVSGPLGAGDEPGTTVGVTCPECGGSLWLSGDPQDPVLSCRIGHRMSPETLRELNTERLERVLWAALRALEEQVAVAGFMEEMHRRRDDEEGAELQHQRKLVVAEQTETMRRFLLSREGD